jgi:hypothetical protein
MRVEIAGKNSCANKYDCKILPNTLVLDFCSNARVSGVTLLDAKFFHLNIFRCKGVTASGPGEVPRKAAGAAKGVVVPVDDDGLGVEQCNLCLYISESSISSVISAETNLIKTL